MTSNKQGSLEIGGKNSPDEWQRLPQRVMVGPEPLGFLSRQTQQVLPPFWVLVAVSAKGWRQHSLPGKAWTCVQLLSLHFVGK